MANQSISASKLDYFKSKQTCQGPMQLERQHFYSEIAMDRHQWNQSQLRLEESESHL